MKRAFLLVLALAGCAKRDRIVVGAKNFTESDLLAEIVAQQIERRTSVPVQRRLHLGGTFVCHNAITAGDIDLYVEYTGTAFTAILKQPPIASPDSVFRFVASEYQRQFQLRWTAPLGFDNTFAILVRRADAERYGLRSIGDLARVASRWKAGFGYEFPSFWNARTGSRVWPECTGCDSPSRRRRWIWDSPTGHWRTVA